jgi:hypothetical protein
MPLFHVKETAIWSVEADSAKEALELVRDGVGAWSDELKNAERGVEILDPRTVEDEAGKVWEEDELA